jgi:acetyl esterase/lipase
MPIGYALSMLLLAVCTTVAVSPPRPRRSSPSNLSFWLSYLVNELPFLAACWLAAATVDVAAQGDLDTPVGLVGAGSAAVAAFGLVVVVRRGLQARAVVQAALATAVGARHGTVLASAPARRPWLRILVWPFPWLFRGRVVRIRNIAYGPAGRAHLLDVYRPRRRAPAGPILIHLHGGAFRRGDKVLDGQPLINRLVQRGWVCVSANYRLGRKATFPDQLVDVKHVIAWVRAHGREHGADADQLVIAGSSAGAHLAAIAAFTPNDARFQPGFATVDTTVRAVVAMYPYPGPIAIDGPPSSPHEYVTAGAPPLFVAHGGGDTLVIPEDARAFARQVHRTSQQPVAYAELPGGQHCFDLFHSLRCEAVIDGVTRFLVASAALADAVAAPRQRRRRGPGRGRDGATSRRPWA